MFDGFRGSTDEGNLNCLEVDGNIDTVAYLEIGQGGRHIKWVLRVPAQDLRSVKTFLL